MAKPSGAQIIVNPDAESLAAAAEMAGKQGPPPVHLWNPPFCGDLDMRIARDGTWYYEGSPIKRKPLVRLFSSILKREGEKFFLVTPVEKVGIIVDDAPFVAVDFEKTGTGRSQSIEFETNVGDKVLAGPMHPIRVNHDPETGEPAPYVLIRANLEALIDRKSFYRLAEIGETETVDETPWFGVWSDNHFFPMIAAEALSRS